ncbi:MAG: hypothetical protein CMJ83_20440 [Planctomycetes bacterium]|nr:hypothetical protein [Planctomycetota bacterium]
MFNRAILIGLAVLLACVVAPAQFRRGGGNAPKEGADAPDFNLKVLKTKKKKIKLSSYEGKKPVALIFGSYT